MITEAIVLAGGFGTRLKSVVQDLPKPMAPINGKPFLYYLLSYLKKNNISKVVLSVGYKAESIQDYFGNFFEGIELFYAQENEPLGTGGGIKKASELIKNDVFFALNGDTFFDIGLQSLAQKQIESNAIGTLALKKMTNFDRYGTVEVKENGFLSAFKEKQWLAEGLINGGVYCLNKSIFNNIEETKFSFETAILEKRVEELSAQIFDNYFIDIGIPEDYAKAQQDVCFL